MGGQILNQASGAQILTVNIGSSSIKLDLLQLTAGGDIRGGPSLRVSHHDVDPLTTLQQFVAQPVVPRAVAHRIVHGGTLLTRPTKLTHDLDSRLDELLPLAPLHNPTAFEWLRSARQAFPGVPQVLVPDTGFFADLPEVSRRYALPATLSDRYGLRRYGFHGIAHEAMLRQWLSSGHASSRIITLQLGAGCSMAAIRDGRPVDTSMGFTPLEGLMMSTRSGDLDAGLVTWLQKVESLSPAETEALLNERSGLLGVSGTTGDMSQLLNDPTESAHLAIDMYVYRARKYLGAYMAVLGGVDAILFGGGVGENAPLVRQSICRDMNWCGIEIDADRNAQAVGTISTISPSGADVEIGVITTDEAVLLAERAAALVVLTNA